MLYIRPRVFRLFRIIVLFQEEEFNRFLDDHSLPSNLTYVKLQVHDQLNVLNFM